MVFGVDPEDRAKRAVWQEGYEPVPLTKPVNVLWLRSPRDEPRVLFCGVLEPCAERVLLDTPSPGYKPMPALVLRGYGLLQQLPLVWFFGPIPFRPGEVKVCWQVKRRFRGWRTVRESHVLCEEWGQLADDTG